MEQKENYVKCCHVQKTSMQQTMKFAATNLKELVYAWSNCCKTVLKIYDFSCTYVYLLYDHNCYSTYGSNIFVDKVHEHSLVLQLKFHII